MKTIIAKRTLHRPGPAFKPAVLDPNTGGERVAATYDVEAIRPGQSVDWDDDAEADTLVARGCAEFPEAKPAPAPVPAPKKPAAQPVAQPGR